MIPQYQDMKSRAFFLLFLREIFRIDRALTCVHFVRKGNSCLKIMVTSIVTMSQPGEPVVSDGPVKSWAIGSAGSAPSSSRVRPLRQLLYVLFDFVCSVFPLCLALELIVHDMLIISSDTERKTCRG